MSSTTASSTQEEESSTRDLGISDIVSSNLFQDTICPYLEAQDIVNLCQMSGAGSTKKNPFQPLRQAFCHMHGTVLDVAHEHCRSDNDVAFLIHYLEQEAFFSTMENKELPSAYPVSFRCVISPFFISRFCQVISRFCQVSCVPFVCALNPL